MSYAPAIPPLPFEYHRPPPQQRDSKPPIPPLPPNFRPEQPLAAPMPERAMPSLPADMARTLDDSLGYSAPPSSRTPLPMPTAPYPPMDPFRRPSPAPPLATFPGGFARPPSAFHPTPTPSSYAGSTYMGSPGHYSLPNAISAMSLSPQPPAPRAVSTQPYPTHHHHHHHQQQQQQPMAPYPQSYGHPHHASSPTPTNGQSRLPELTAPLPNTDSLTVAQRALPSHPGPEHVHWIRDVLFLVDRVVTQHSPDGQPPDGAVSISDPTLRRLAHDAIRTLLVLLNVAPAAPPYPPHVAEALYLRGTLLNSGAFPDQLVRNPRDAFRDFETSARAGFQKAWFKLGRDYEAVGDLSRAKDCFERGVRGGVESCFYRMGMARLLGQLSLPASPADALPLLHRAATLASTEVPQPAYVYGLILLGEFTQVSVDERLFAPLIPHGSSPLHEARKFVERAAFLSFAPAQYKLGHAYEYATPPFPFDPLLSVQYYSLASQQGEPEADMALSKWFLCGAEGAFDKDEALALTFADKAARKGLASAEFAMGYYAEVGVGRPKDVDAARRWYAKAVEHGNTDAPERLRALSQPSPQALSRTEHDQITDAKLVRRRTQARANAAAEGRHGPPAIRDGQGVVDKIQAAATAHPSQKSPSLRQSSLPHQSPPPTTYYRHTPSPSPVPPLVPPPSQTQTRYTLTDSPAPTISDSPPPPGGGGGRAAGRHPGRRVPGASMSASMNEPDYQGHPGSGSSSGPAPTPAPAPAPASAPVPTGHGPTPSVTSFSSPSLPAPSTTLPRRSPATFAEMGFQSGKAEDKECVIM